MKDSRCSQHMLFLQVIAASALLAAALVLSGCADPVPSLTSLRDSFESHRGDFESVAASARTHGDMAIAPTYSSTPTGPVPAALRDRYKGFLRRVGATQIQFSYGGDIDVLMGSEGLAVSGVEWGYSHPQEPPDGVRPWSDADAYHDEFSYFELGDGWYVYVYRF